MKVMMLSSVWVMMSGIIWCCWMNHSAKMMFIIVLLMNGLKFW